MNVWASLGPSYQKGGKGYVGLGRGHNPPPGPSPHYVHTPHTCRTGSRGGGGIRDLGEGRIHIGGGEGIREGKGHVAWTGDIGMRKRNGGSGSVYAGIL